MMKEDALAVIDLAEACNMFEGKNYTATGVCYNNIANFQIKNGKFGLAAENFVRAAKIAEICLGRISAEAYFTEYDPDFVDFSPVQPLIESNERYYNTVLAHRKYQYALCLYKELKYN
jgi:hypothetical protein